MSRDRIGLAVLVPNLRRVIMALFCMLLLLGCVCAEDSVPVPGLVKFSGTISGTPTGTDGVMFAFYKDQTGGAPLWQEVQNVTIDASGRYTTFLGARSTKGIPVNVFSNGEARWLGVQPDGQAEQARVLLVSVPYALKSSDAETLGGYPASAFLRADNPAAVKAFAYVNTSAVNAAANKIASPAIVATNATTGYVPLFVNAAGDLNNSLLFQRGSNLGFGTTTPAYNLNFVSETDPAAIAIDGYGAVGINYIGRRAEGTLAAPSALFANDNIMAMQGRGYGATRFSPYSRAYMKFFAAENWSDTVQGTYITLATTTKGTSPSASATERMRIDDRGYVGIGTSAPTSPLTVSGPIQSTTGGFVFPDSTVQTTAAVQGVALTSDGTVTVGGSPVAPTLAVNATVIQKRVTGTCATGWAVSTVHADGTVNCVAVGGGSGGGTNGPMFITLNGGGDALYDSTLTGVAGARIHSDQSIVVTDVTYTTSDPGSGVCTPALARVTNGTIYEDIPIVPGIASYNTTDHAVVFPPNSDISIVIAQAENCGQYGNTGNPPAVLAGSVRYQVASGQSTSCPSNLVLFNGSCIDTRYDPQNCGSAGKACAGSSLNTYATCNNGACGTNGCTMGYSDCDGKPANGCEANTQSDSNNCGYCGSTCAKTIVNGTAGGCSNSQCVVSCNSGYTACNNGPNSCADLKSDANNCGACNTHCVTGISNGSATGVCTSGGCGYTCNAGYSLCAASYSANCANFQTDQFNCGGCGVYCASGICSAGHCQ